MGSGQRAGPCGREAACGLILTVIDEAVVDLDNSVEDMDADDNASELTEDGIPTESDGSIEDESVTEAMEEDAEDMSFV
jgi:hypothetical protein